MSTAVASIALDSGVEIASGELKTWSAAIASVTACATAAIAARVPDLLPNPPVARMREAIINVQAWSRGWTGRMRPSLVSTIPADVIGYAGTFDIQARRILEILSRPAAPNPAELAPLFALLQQDLRTRIHRIAALYSEIANEFSALNTQFRALRAAKDDAVRAVRLDESQLENMVVEYRTLCAATSAKDDVITFFAAPIGESSTFANLVSLHPTVGGVRLLVQVGVKVAAWFGAGDPMDEIRARARRLDDLRQAMPEEQRRVAAMRLVLDEVQPLLGVADEAVRASADILKFWRALETKLGSVLSAAERGDGQTLALLGRIHVETARKSWSQLADYARGLKLD